MLAKPDEPTELIPMIGPEIRDRTPARRRGRWIAAGAAGLLLIAAATAVVLRGSGGGERPAATTTAAVATAALVRRDMTDSTALTGTLGYGTPHALAGHRAGTITWLPQPGSLIRRGQQLFRADDQPVPLFYGAMPLFRTIAGRNTAGRDVRIIADNLEAMGYAIGRQPSPGDRVTQPGPTPAPSASPSSSPIVSVTVQSGESVLTPALTAAIKRWQRASSLPVTGTIAVGTVAVESGAVRVDSLAVQPGAPADGPLMSVTPTGKVISVPADPAQAGSISRGDKVTIDLPGDRTVPGKVTAVGTAIAVPDGSTGGADAAKLTVTVTVDDPKTVARIDSAEVQVNFVADTHRNVLTAPVGALVALSEGGYAVQLAAGGLVAVKTGMFANGWVEISGAGLSAGTEVVTTS